jgi:hypothetical protein
LRKDWPGTDRPAANTDAVRPQQQVMYTMIIESNNKDSHKSCSTAHAVENQKQPENLVFYPTAKAKTTSQVRRCGCPGSGVGKIKLDASAHQASCWVRKRIATKGYVSDTSVVPTERNDGYALGVAV